MKFLKQHWKVLKDEKANVNDKKISYEKIMTLQSEIQELDPTFNVIDLETTKYAEFKSKNFKSNLKSNVNWPKWDGKFGEREMKELEKWTAVAVQITRDRLPLEPEDSQKFGMIVSATTDKLLTIIHS